jgi:hypothetical protein
MIIVYIMIYGHERDVVINSNLAEEGDKHEHRGGGGEMEGGGRTRVAP